MYFSPETNSAVFYFFKRLDNALTLECSVTMMPLHQYNTCGYTFKLTAHRGKVSDSETLENITRNRDKAEQLFNHICSHNILPAGLSAAAKLVSTE